MTIPEPRADAPDTSAVEHEWTRPSFKASLAAAIIIGLFGAVVSLKPLLLLAGIAIAAISLVGYILAMIITEWLNEQ